MKPFGRASLPMLLGLLFAPAASAADAYEDYIRTSEDFRVVKQEKAWALHAFPSWTFMPWTHQWTIGYNDGSGRWSLAHGYNRAFIDRAGFGFIGLASPLS